jgi:hypothetical protein
MSERNDAMNEQYKQQIEAREGVTRLEPSGDADHDRLNSEMFGLPVEDEGSEKKPAKKAAAKKTAKKG